MMHLLPNRIVVALVLAATQLMSAWTHAQSCSGFQRGAVGDDYIVSHYSSAVLSVAGIGTAYLIDAEHGYLITASHVVSDVAGANRQLVVTNPAAPGVSALAHQVAA